MNIKSLLYLAQLEEYQISRISDWLEKNPGLTVTEKKGLLRWTTKIYFLYILTSFFSFFVKNHRALFLSLYIITPFDHLIKYLFVNLATLKFKLFHQHTTVIAITGSWGKTTTKEALVHLLKNKYQVRSTLENQNTLLSIAKQVLLLPRQTEFFIVEIGAYQIGDISSACKIINPSIGIITAIGSMHLERFGTQKNILRAKMELAQGIRINGSIYLNSKIKPQIMNFPLKTKNIFYFKDNDQLYHLIAQKFDLPLDFKIPEIKHRLQTINTSPITVIDDSYNSNPLGFALALEKLKDSNTKIKILITPGMIELGDIQDRENEALAKLSATIATHIIIIGQTNKDSLLSGIKKSSKRPKIFTVDALKEAQVIIQQIAIPDNTTVLFENDLPDNYF